MSATREAASRSEGGAPTRGLFEPARAETHPDSPSEKLRGRTYAIPFDRVWNEVLDLVASRPRWTKTRADDETGVVEVVAETLVFRISDDVRIDVSLDSNGQTRVDVVSASRRGWTDFGKNARRIGRFIRDLDRALQGG